MVRKMNSFKKGMLKHSLSIIVILSIIHIGIAYIHSRESGRADFPG